MNRADVSRYCALPYQVLVVRETDEQGDRFYVAMHPELNGCVAQGATSEEAIQSLREARELYLSVLLDAGLTPPPPRVIDFEHPDLTWVPAATPSDPKELLLAA